MANKDGVYESKSAVRFRREDLIHQTRFPNKTTNYVDIATDIDGTSAILRSVSFSEFAVIGMELNFRDMAVGATVNVFTSNSGLLSGSAVASVAIPAGDSNNIIQIDTFAYTFVVIELTGLTTGQIHNLTIHGKNN